MSLIILKPSSTEVELEDTGNNKIYLFDDSGSSTITITNGGYSDTTDWTNPTSGLAQYWNVYTSFVDCSIVTGNGFTGNAQRAQRKTGIGGSVNIYTDTYLSLSSANTYRITFEYRCSIDGLQVYFYDGGSTLDGFGTAHSANTGNAISVSSTDSPNFNPTSIIFSTINAGGTGPTDGWLEIDNIHLEQL